MNFELENCYKELERLEFLRRKTEINLVTLLDSFNSFDIENDETEDRQLVLEKACTLLKRINSGISKVKQINEKCGDCDSVTADRFLQYLIIDELKGTDHNIPIVESMPFSNSLYKHGYVGDAFVTHVVDQVRGLCYIVDLESMARLKGLFDQQLQPLEHIPEPREQFAYLYEGTILFRAIRCDEFHPYTDEKFDAFLTDIGCKVKVDINKSKKHFFVLSDAVKSISGYMRKCQIVNMPRDLNTLDLLHARIHYQIIFNDGKTVYINVLAENSQEFYGNQPDDQQNFYSYLWADSAQLSSIKICEMCNTSPQMVSEAISIPAAALVIESTEQNMAITRVTMPLSISESNPSKDKVTESTGKIIAEPAANSRKHNGTEVATGRKTRADIATMLYNSKEEDVKQLDMELPNQISEPHTSSETISQSILLPTAPKAVASIEKNIEEFRKILPATTSESNPSKDKVAEITGKNIAERAENNRKHNGTKVATGRKTRGDIATMLYNSKEEDIKLLDKEMPHLNIEPQPQATEQQLSKERMGDSHEKLMTIFQLLSNIPSIGKKVMVQATSILDVSKFYGYDVEHELRYEQYFERFCKDSLCKIESQPQVNDKILAHYENLIYRAFVTQIFDTNLFQVFCLDFGYYCKVTSANIFKWDASMDEFPFRALRFRINRIRPLFQNDICGILGARQILLATAFEATVVDVCDDDGLTTVVIDANDENNLDIATTLAMKKLAVYD